MLTLQLAFLLHILSRAYGYGFIPQIVDWINVEVVQEKSTGYLNCTMVLEESQLNVSENL